MKIILKNLDHRNIGSVVTWLRQVGDYVSTTTTEVLGFTHSQDGTTLHTPLGDRTFPGDTMVDIQLPKQSVLLMQLLTELEDQGGEFEDEQRN